MRSQILVGAFTLAIDPIIPNLLSSIYFYSGGKNWKIPLMPAMIFPLISFMISFFIPESPRYLYAKKNWKELRKVIKTIARINGTKMNHDYAIEGEIKSQLRKSKTELRTAVEQYETVSSLKITRRNDEFSVLSALKDTQILVNFIVCLC